MYCVNLKKGLKIMSAIISNGTLFPYNKHNDNYEKDAALSRSAICTREWTICALGATLLIGSQILQKLNPLDLSDEKLATITTYGTIATVATLLGGLCVTRHQLARINVDPPLDPSNSLTRAQVQQFLTIAKIKEHPPQITQLISHLEQVNRDTGYARTYFTPAQREAFKQIDYIMTKGEIVGILERARDIKSQREKEWEVIWKKEADESEMEKIKSRGSPSTLGRFSIEESECGHGSIKLIKYPPKLAQIDHLICVLEKAIKGLDEDASIVDVGDEARFLLQIEKLEPIQQRPEVTDLKKLTRTASVLQPKLPGVQGSMRLSPTTRDFSPQMDAPSEIEPASNNN